MVTTSRIGQTFMSCPDGQSAAKILKVTKMMSLKNTVQRLNGVGEIIDFLKI
jgi:hypothetical protein